MQRTGSRGVVSQHSALQPVLEGPPGTLCGHEVFQHPKEAAARTSQTQGPRQPPSVPNQASILEESFWEPLPRKVYVRTVLPAEQIHLPGNLPKFRTCTFQNPRS